MINLQNTDSEVFEWVILKRENFQNIVKLTEITILQLEHSRIFLAK